MATPSKVNGIIPSTNVKRAQQAALIDCGDSSNGKSAGTLAVIPILEGDVVAGIEVRCSCGASTMVECVYGEET